MGIRKSGRRAVMGTRVARSVASLCCRVTSRSSSLVDSMAERCWSVDVKNLSSTAAGRQISSMLEMLPVVNSMFATSTGSSRFTTCSISGDDS